MVELKQYDLKFAEAYSKLRTNPNIYINGLDITPNPLTVDDAIALFTKSMEKRPAERLLIFYNNEFCGDISISVMGDICRFNAELGYWIAEPFWNKGIATVAIELMTKYVFDNFNIQKIVACVYEFNKASMRALEKNGYILEALLKKEIFKNGAFYDDYRWIKFREANNY